MLAAGTLVPKRRLPAATRSTEREGRGEDGEEGAERGETIEGRCERCGQGGERCRKQGTRGNEGKRERAALRLLVPGRVGREGKEQAVELLSILTRNRTRACKGRHVFTVAALAADWLELWVVHTHQSEQEQLSPLDNGRCRGR